ncbi:MAG: hypothetical protein ACTSYB_15815 [Candidatus Helarchaeota archaeon]
MSPKKENTENGAYVTVYIHEPKLMSEVKSNLYSKSGGIFRVRGFLKKEKVWTTLSYRIPLNSLGLDDTASKKEILDRLLNPNIILNKDTKGLITKLLDQYGPIKPKGRNKLEYKTERFKKKWKMKTRRIGGV